VFIKYKKISSKMFAIQCINHCSIVLFIYSKYLDKINFKIEEVKSELIFITTYCEYFP